MGAGSQRERQRTFRWVTGYLKSHYPSENPRLPLPQRLLVCPPFSHPYRGKRELGDREGGRTGFLCEKAASTFQKKSGDNHVYVSMAWQTQ